MEASEKPQLPLNPDVPDGAVRAIGDRLVIESLTVTDERAARIVRERAELGQAAADTVAKAIEIGARMLDREQTDAEAQDVRQQFEVVAEQVREGFGDRAEQVTEQIQEVFDRALAGEGSALEERLKGHSEELAEQVAQHFGADRSTAVQHQIKDLVREELVKLTQHLASESEANPLQLVKGEVLRTLERERKAQQGRDNALGERIGGLEQRIVQLVEREEADRRVAEEVERGTAKGRPFEERINAVLELVAADRGDAAHAVGDTLSAEGGKKGDTLIEIGAEAGPVFGRIAVEAKTDRNLTRPDAWRELNGAMEKRDAGYAIMVVAGEECIPSNTKPWLEYEGNKMIVAVNPDEPERLTLEAAYTIARSRVLAKSEQELQVDAPGVRDAVQQALADLRSVSTIRKHLTGVSNSTDSARSTLAEMEERVKASLTRIEELVLAGDAESADQARK
jgi:hypothetical protein